MMSPCSLYAKGTALPREASGSPAFPRIGVYGSCVSSWCGFPSWPQRIRAANPVDQPPVLVSVGFLFPDRETARFVVARGAFSGATTLSTLQRPVSLCVLEDQSQVPCGRPACGGVSWAEWHGREGGLSHVMSPETDVAPDRLTRR